MGLILTKSSRGYGLKTDSDNNVSVFQRYRTSFLRVFSEGAACSVGRFHKYIRRLKGKRWKRGENLLNYLFRRRSWQFSAGSWQLAAQRILRQRHVCETQEKRKKSCQLQTANWLVLTSLSPQLPPASSVLFCLKGGFRKFLRYHRFWHRSFHRVP